jgi:hypothetical protein
MQLVQIRCRAADSMDMMLKPKTALSNLATGQLLQPKLCDTMLWFKLTNAVTSTEDTWGKGSSGAICTVLF